MKRFEVGKAYNPMDCGYDPITILKRTDKTVWVRGGSGNEWRMLVRHNGKSEFVTDSSVPRKWRFAFTYFADNEA